MNKQLALEFAKLSNIAYMRDIAKASFMLEQMGYASPTFYDIDDSQCMICRHDKYVVVAFRGTQFTEGVFADILSNFHNNSIVDELAIEELIHSGYNKALWKLIPTLISVLKEYNDVDIYFVGHSMGGALATMLAGYITIAKAVYSYGAPKPGGSEFWRKLQTPVYRIVNKHDFAQFWPLQSPFQQGGELWCLTKNALTYKQKPRFLGLVRGIHEHHIEFYIKRLETVNTLEGVR